MLTINLLYFLTRYCIESNEPQIQKLLEKCHELLAYKEIALCWIPSHIGIHGNEMVDKQAKTSLSLEPTFFNIPFSNFKPSINKYILEEWQTTCTIHCTSLPLGMWRFCTSKK